MNDKIVMIDGESLELELDAFMMKIIDAIRVRSKTNHGENKMPSFHLEYDYSHAYFSEDDSLSDWVNDSQENLELLRKAHSVLSDKIAMLDRYNDVVNYLTSLSSDQDRQCVINRFCTNCGGTNKPCFCMRDD